MKKYGPQGHAGDHTRHSGGNADCVGGEARKKLKDLALGPRSSNRETGARGTASGFVHYPSESVPTRLPRKQGQGNNV